MALYHGNVGDANDAKQSDKFAYEFDQRRSEQPAVTCNTRHCALSPSEATLSASVMKRFFFILVAHVVVDGKPGFDHA